MNVQILSTIFAILSEVFFRAINKILPFNSIESNHHIVLVEGTHSERPLDLLLWDERSLMKSGFVHRGSSCTKIGPCCRYGEALSHGS